MLVKSKLGIPLQPSKADAPIDVQLDGNVTDVKDVQFLKQFCGIEVILPKFTTLVIKGCSRYP